MNIALTSLNRPGITQEVLLCIGQHQLDLAALEVVKEHIYLDLPTLSDSALHELGPELLNIEGVQTLKTIDLLPNERRRRHLDALLSTLPDPVFAVDAQGRILSANAAAAQALGSDEKALIGEAITHFLFDDKGRAVQNLDAGDHNLEVRMAGQSYWLETKPIKMSDDSQSPQDQMLSLQTPQRLGHQLSKIQPRGAEGFALIAGQSESLLRTKERAQRFASIQAPLLIQGETGTGKELVARALHDLGSDPDAPFLALNCAVLSPDTFEAEMFGVSGQTQGRLVAASGGTLFLDEICSCPLPVQAKLLRVLEDKTVLPVGATQPVPVTLRVVSATNEEVALAVSDGRLRQDLLFRINTIVLTLPPLRQRRDDLTLLSTHFLAEYARIYEIAMPELSQDDLAALLAHDWPGNVRELRNVCERRILAARRGGGSMVQALQNDSLFDDVPDTLREAVASFERELIAKAIRAHQGRMDAAAEALGIGRRTLNEKIVKLGLDKDALI